MEDAYQKVSVLKCFKNPQDMKLLSGGLTNVNVLVSDGGRKYVVRLGEDIPEHGVMRWNELVLSKAASAAGFSPKVIHSESGVLVIDFIEAKTFTDSDVRDPDNFNRVISLLAKVHNSLTVHLTQPALTFWPYHVNRAYIARLLSDDSVYKKALKSLLKQNNELEIATGKIDLVICHNDLLAANILDDGNKLWLIDWEYGGFNSPLFDLAGLASNNNFSEEQERQMLSQYFGTNNSENWRSYSALKCSSLMRETLWSMTSEIHSKLDLNYAEYTTENMNKLSVAMTDFAQI